MTEIGKYPQPILAIRCLTYNHGKYIRQCLEGFVMQKTTFPFIAIVHDDASTDDTPEIIKEYEKKYPDIIKPIYEIENQYSKGNDVIEKCFENATPDSIRYIAICEGDDYWTDSLKLQKQVDFLEKHPEYTAVAENAIVHYLSTNKRALFSAGGTRDITLREILITRVFPTASVVYRANVQTEFVRTCKNGVDTVLWAFLAKKGKIRYFDRVTSVYNRGTQGVVLGTDPYVWLLKCEKWNEELRQLCADDFDADFFKKRIRKECAIQLLRSLKRMKINKNTLRIVSMFFKYI